jgi:arylsulfatase A-like enzyme
LREFSLADGTTTLAERFAAAGYTTSAHVCGPVTADTGLDAGFDTFESRARDRTLYTDWYDEYRSHLAGLSDPWFAYLHLWEAHIPRDVPPETTGAETSYDASLRGVADRLPELLGAVDLENTIVAVTGDHGESIFDGTLRNKVALVCLRQLPIPITGMRTKDLREAVYDRYLRPRGVELEEFYNGLRRFSGVEFPNALHRQGHGYHVYDFLVQVPFLLAGPGIPDRSRVGRQVRQVDVLPTLLAAAGIDPPTDVAGQNLLGDDYEHRPARLRAVSAYDSREKWLDGVRYDGWKFVKGRGRSLYQLFDLEADPAELDNVAGQYPETAAELEALVDEAVARESRMESTASRAATERMTRRLEDLGYL